MAEISLRTETPNAKIEATPIAPEIQAAPTPEVASDPRIEHLAKKERLLRHRDRQFKEEKAKLEAEIQAYKQKDLDYQSNYIPKQKLREQTWDVLANEGISYDQLTQQAIQNPITPEAIELRKIQKRLKQQDETISSFKTEAQKQQEAQYNQALKLIERDVKTLVAADPDTYEAIRAQGADAEQAVVELIRETFDQEGILITPEEALKEVEEYLIEGAFKVAQLKKVQARLKPKESEIVTDPPLVRPERGLKVEPSTTRPSPQAPSRTLTHQNPMQQKPLSSKDRRERAIAAFQGKL